MSERKLNVAHTEKCPTCGTYSTTFDPPLVFNLAESCGETKPGTYVSGEEIPTCEIAKGHDGKHVFLVEKLIEW